MGCRRYAYLGGADAGGRGFSNPFDRGLVPNCLQFWGDAQPDWAQEYHSGMQASPFQQPLQQKACRLEWITEWGKPQPLSLQSGVAC